MAKAKNLDLVWVSYTVSGARLVCAPAFSGLKKEDEVFCGDEDFPGRVIDVTTVYTNDSIYPFILKVAGAGEPLPRIRKKITYITESFHYDDEPKEDTDG